MKRVITFLAIRGGVRRIGNFMALSEIAGKCPALVSSSLRAARWGIE